MSAITSLATDFTSIVPDEILAEIFVAGRHKIDCTAPSSKARIMGCVDTPMVFNIIGVCRRWRSVALSTPALWSYLFLRPTRVKHPSTGASDGDRMAQSFFETCMVRSVNQPLDMLIGETPGFDQLTYVMATSDRWRTLTIHDKELSMAIESHAFNGLAGLRYLDLVIRRSSHTSNDLITQIGIELPNLVTFRLRIAEYRAVCLPFKLSIPNVTHISMNFVTSPQVLPEIASMLSSLPRLSHLSFVCMPSHGLVIPSTISWTLNLPHLQKLELRSGFQSLWNILSRCRMPSLTHLRIESLRAAREWGWVGGNRIASDAAHFLNHCPQLESFAAQSTDFGAFMQVLLRAQPRFVTLGEDSDDGTLHMQINSLITHLVNQDFEWIEEFALYDGRMYNGDIPGHSPCEQPHRRPRANDPPS